MYAKLFTLAALAAAVTAAPQVTNECNTGSIQCCNSFKAANSATIQEIVQRNPLIGAALASGPINALVGLTCNPLNRAGISGGSCSTQPVCCKNNSFNGVVAIGCTPVNVNF